MSRCALKTRCGRELRAALLAEHVALLVDADVGQARLLEHLRVQRRALGFLEWRRLDFAQPNLIVDRLRLGGADAIDGRFDRPRPAANARRAGRRSC